MGVYLDYGICIGIGVKCELPVTDALNAKLLDNIECGGAENIVFAFSESERWSANYGVARGKRGRERKNLFRHGFAVPPSPEGEGKGSLQSQ